MVTYTQNFTIEQDSFTLDIIQSNLRAISKEMFEVMKRTSVSPIIYEVLDMGCALTDAHGNLITSGAGLPSFIGMLNRNVKHIIKQYGDNIYDGDVFICNSPYHGGITHLNDVLIARPLFVDNICVAWAVNMGHWPDIGGMVAGSMSTDATEIFQEGLILPAIKLMQQGQLCDSVLEIIMANSRLPQSIQGDLWAGVSAVNLGQRHLQDMCAKYGVKTVQIAMHQIIKQSETEAKNILKTLPKKTFSTNVMLEDFPTFPLYCTVKENAFILDLTHAPKQTATPYNVGHDGIYAAAQIVFKALISPHTPANEGNYKSIQIKTKQGSIFHPVAPAAQGLNFENRMVYFDALLKIAIQIAPEKFGAGHFSSICGTFINGRHSQTGQNISLAEPQIGGWGASVNHDGANAMFSASHGDTFICPAEISEARYGLRVQKYALSSCQSGQGQFVGGKGIEIIYQTLCDNVRLTIAYSKGKQTTWGYNGGHNGGNNYVIIKRSDGKKTRHNYISNTVLNTNDQVIIHTANGGGFGPAEKRCQKQVLRDVKNGYITEETATNIYNL